MTQLEQYKKAYATLVGMVDRTISALEATPPEKMTPALTANRLKMALGEAEEIFLAEDPEDI